MIEAIINGLNYRLNEETLTAEVTAMRNGYEGYIIIPGTVVLKEVAYRVKSIGDAAFYKCSSLTSIVIPDSVKSIRDHAFGYCSSLTSIVIPDSVKSIGDETFSGCSSLTSIVIPDSVTSIGNFAFNGCFSLTSIVIGNGVKSIGKEAFKGCSSLTNITFQGTMAQWNRIKLGSAWKYKVPTKVVHCTDGVVEI